jgi:23S rRNA pseudouridine1911/1915/1917 synthase
MTEAVELVVGLDEADRRLDVALAGVAGVGSRAAAQRLIDAGRVTVDGRARPKRHVLAVGERVVIGPSEDAVGAGGPIAEVEFGVVHEDEHLIVVDKPAGLVVHPAPGHRGGTLAQALAARGAAGGESWRPGIVHRLDRNTSGLMVVAKSERVHRALQRGIEKRQVQRGYLALVEGRPASRSGTIDAPIGRDRRRRTVMSTRTDRPRTARTHFEVEEALPGATLLRVTLETGRTHQIRAHLAAIGHPVLGDREYGRGGQALGDLDRQFLHSAELAFDHPVTGARLRLQSPLPDDLRAALEIARGRPLAR